MINPASQGSRVGLVGFIADHQLRVIEAIRRGVALWVTLELHVTSVDGEPGHLLRGWGTEQFAIQPGEWASALELADAGSYIELLVPLPTNAQNRVLVGHD